MPLDYKLIDYTQLTFEQISSLAHQKFIYDSVFLFFILVFLIVYFYFLFIGFRE